jgi:hypothetical protein
MVEQHQWGGGGYNEVVIEASTWIQNLPRSIEAVFFSGEWARGHVSEVHRMFH